MSDTDESSEEQKIISDFVPREYQVEILEKAIKENVLVFLPTGAGKTFIAVMLMKEFLPVIKKKYSQGGQRIFFLVNTTVLVRQQAQAIRNLLPVEVGEYVGAAGVDDWDGSKWLIEQDNHNILVMTAQIYLNMIDHSFTDVSKACLLIFDECHQGVKCSPMRQIMMKINKLALKNNPKIFGLTATLLNKNVSPERVEDEIQTLEDTFHARVVRALNNEMVLQYSANPKEKLLLFKPVEKHSHIYNLINLTLCKFQQVIACLEISEKMLIIEDPPENATLMNDLTCKPLNKAKLGLTDARKISDELGLYGADVTLLSLIITIECMKTNCEDTVFRVLCYVETSLHLLRKRLYNLLQKVPAPSRPLANATDKLNKLAGLLEDFPEDFRAIIFVDRRSTAHALHHIFMELSKVNEKYKSIKSNYVVGVNQSSQVVSRETLLSEKRNKIIMTQFNRGDLNVLFASNVIEEGVDVKACNLVIKFDMPTTFRSYTQSKGRARHKISSYIIIAPQPGGDHPNIEISYSKFKTIEEVLNQVLCNNTENNEVVPMDDDDDDADADDMNQEYCNEYGSKVNGLSSISLINRYCASLPQDRFSSLTTLWWIKEIIVDAKKYFVGFLRLPINSPLKETIEGKPRRNKVSAKRLVALEACKRLNELGEFNSHFLPIGHKTNLLHDSLLFPLWDNNYVLNKNNKKFMKGRNVYTKHFTKWECNAKPVSGQDVFMHVIKLSPNYAYPETSRLQAFYSLLLEDSTFCVLSSSSWPTLPSFPLFMNVGEVKAELLSNCGFLQLSQTEIDQLQQFLKLLFSEAIPLLKSYSVMNENFTIDDFLIAPVKFSNQLYEIDWDAVQKHHRFPELRPKPFDEHRLDGPVTVERYHLKVIVPWYRQGNYNMKYVVTKVREDLTPTSEFPSDNYKAYTNYYLNHYKQKIYDTNQPMLEVRAVSSKINCICPRAEYMSRRQKREEEGYEETLVPELCHLLTFPSCYLVKATLLPSAFHRIHHLLIAEELRQLIAEEAQLGSLDPPPNAQWKSLTVTADKNSNEMAVDEPNRLGEFSTNCNNNSSRRSSIQDLNMDDPLIMYPDEEEPVDLDRNLNVDLASILEYSNFVDKPVKKQNEDFREVPIRTNFKINRKFVEPLKILNGSPTRHGPEIVDILEALTAAASNDVLNYERAELLGDSFLKFGVSLALFTFYPMVDEGKLTQIKGKIIGNLNLYFCGIAKNLPSLLKVNAFDFNDWKVPGFSFPPELKPLLEDPKMSSILLERLADADLNKEDISSLTVARILDECNLKAKSSDIAIEDLIEVVESSDEETSVCRKVQNISSKNEYLLKQTVPEKVVSDSVEALICVYLNNFGIEGGFRILNWFSILPDGLCDIEKMLYSESESPLLNPDCDYSRLLPNLDVLESDLGYTFKNKAFILQALTHSSHPHCMTDCYQRLEFLGDAILDFLLTAYIYNEYKNMNPGQLTDLRSALVNNVTFACLSVRHRFHTHLLSKSCQLTDIISRFVRYQECRAHEIGYEIFYLLEEADCQVAECIDIPKALGDLFESIIGAIYLDSGKDLNQVWTVIYNIMENEIKTFSRNIPKNPIRMLYEKFPTYPPKFGKAESKNELVTVPLEIRDGDVHKVFHGLGENKSFAKLAAAKIALKNFKIT